MHPSPADASILCTQASSHGFRRHLESRRKRQLVSPEPMVDAGQSAHERQGC
jgi:hypothetical protein